MVDIHNAALSFYDGMVKCALFIGWTEHEENRLDTMGYTESDISNDALSYLRREAYTACSIAVNLGALNDTSDYKQAGIDFWFTRNGEGAGYHERPETYGTHAITILEGIAEGFGEAELYEIGNNRLELNARLYEPKDTGANKNTPVPDPQITINDLWEELR